MARTFVRSTSYAISGSFAHGIGTGDFTFACWAYQTASGSYSALWANGTYDPAFYMEAGSRPPILYGIGGGDIAFNTTLSLNTWYHLAVRRSGTTITCWVNGVQEANTGTRSGSMPTGVQRIANSSGAGVEGFSGRIAEAGLWAAALTAGEIASLAGGAHPTRVRRVSMKAYWPIHGVGSPEPDYSGGGAHLTLTGSPAQAAHCRVGLPHFETGYRGAVAAAVAAGGQPARRRRVLIPIGQESVEVW